MTEKRSSYGSEIERDNYLSIMEELGGIGFWKLNIDDRVVKWSSRVFDIHEYPEELGTPTLEKCIGFYHPDDIEMVQKYVEEAIIHHVGFAFKFKLITHKGNVRIVESYGRYGGKNSDPFLCGTFRDITDEHTAKEKLEFLGEVLEEAKLSVIVCDNDGKIVMTNKGFEALTGFSEAEVIGKKPNYFLQGPKTKISTRQLIKTRLDNEKPVECEILNYHKDGHQYWIHLKITPIFQQGKLTHFVGIQNDISHEKQRLEVLAQASHFDVLNRMVGGIAHDFNNSLAIMRAHIDLIYMANINDKKLNNSLDKIASSIDKSSEQTKRLLQFSHSNTTQTSVLKVSNIVSDVFELLKSSMLDVVSFEYSPTNETIYSDVNRSLFEDVIINLILNAKEACTKNGKITISTSVEVPNWIYDGGVLPPVDIHDKYFLIQIKDNGKGIENEDIDKIFLPFYSTKNNSGARGIGLSMVFNFVTQSNAYLGIKSTPNIGTVFDLWLPITKTKYQEENLESSSKSYKIEYKNILLIDDEVDISSAIGVFLTSKGYTVTTCSSVKKALTFIDQQPFQLIISDIILPNDIAPSIALKKALKVTNDVKILLISGYHGALEPFMKQFPLLQKPFTGNQLLKKLQDL